VRVIVYKQINPGLNLTIVDAVVYNIYGLFDGSFRTVCLHQNQPVMCYDRLRFSMSYMKGIRVTPPRAHVGPGWETAAIDAHG
jgi:hypothetical protein